MWQPHSLDREAKHPGALFIDIHLIQINQFTTVFNTLGVTTGKGKSLKNIGYDLRTPVFSHGRLYAGLSRCNRLKVLQKEEDGEKTANIVNKEILTVDKIFI